MKQLSLVVLFALSSSYVFNLPGATFTVSNTNASGAGSFAQAIDDANNNSGADTIAFNIPGSPPFTIRPTSQIRSLNGRVTIDGTTQSGYAGKPIIELDGSLAGVQAIGLSLSGGANIVRGLVINRFDNYGISMNLTSNVIENCYIGTDVAGTKAAGNRQDGIQVGGAFNRIGGGTPGSGNVISGNGASGIWLSGSNNIVQGNFIGTDATSSVSMGNGTDGISVPEFLGGLPDNSLIGGITPGEGNVIAFNTQHGILLGRGAGVAIVGNSIFANGSIGIDLGANGPSVNDPNDFDNGANGLQNYPLITSANPANGNTTIQGTLNSKPGATYRVELFSNPSPKYTFAFSEGKIFLGATNLTTDASGSVSFSFVVAGAATNVTATATDSANNTSEYSRVALPTPANISMLPGDLFVGTAAGTIQWRRGDGTAVRLLNTGTNGNVSGLALDRAGNLVATVTSSSGGGSMFKFDPNGNLLGRFGGGFSGNSIGGLSGRPGDIVLDALGNAYVGTDNGDNDIFKFDPAGNLLAQFDVGIQRSSSYPLDLAADQHTLVYTSGGDRVLRFDTAANTQLPDLATNLPGAGNVGIRLLPGGGALVGNNNILRLDASGQVIKTYTADFIRWSFIHLDPDGNSFWTGVSGRPYLYKFDIDSGALVTRLFVDVPTGPAGLAVRGEITAATSDVALLLSVAPDLVSIGQKFTYTLTVVNSRATPVTGVIVSNTLPSATFSKATASQGTFAQAGNIITFNVGSLSSGSSAVLTIEAVPTTSGGITNAAVVVANELDPSSNNYRTAVGVLVANGPVTPTTVFTTNNSGPGSLRAALTYANENPDTNLVVTFNIPGPGVHTIRPLSRLPVILNAVTIDGYSQPGSKPNSLTKGDNAVLLIELDGSLAGNNAWGLAFAQAGGQTGGGDVEQQIDGIGVRVPEQIVRGLVINRFSGDGIQVQSFSPFNPFGALGVNFGGVAVQGCFVGTDATGTTALPNGRTGVNLNAPSDHCLIGGPAPEDRNLISGNQGGGVLILTLGTTKGFDRIQGNYIGTDVSGQQPLPNNGAGVAVLSFNTAVGGSSPGAGNVIAFNKGPGVSIRKSSNLIQANSIFSNDGLGIDLDGDGVSPNDPGDLLDGANDGLNFPEIIAADPGSTKVRGTLNSSPNGTFTIEVFTSRAADPSGYGEGETFLGKTTVTTDAEGNGAFAADVSRPLVAGEFITATTISFDNDTSEFSRAVLVALPTDLGIAQTDSLDPIDINNNLTYALTITNRGPATATGVVVTDVLSPRVTYVSGSPGCEISNGVVTCQISDLPGGAAAQVTIVVKPNRVGTVINTASVASLTADPDQSNNQSSESTTVTAPSAAFVVTHTGDSGSGSLRQAIFDANNHPGADSITFNVGALPVGDLAEIYNTHFRPNPDGSTTIGGKAGPIRIAADAAGNLYYPDPAGFIVKYDRQISDFVDIPLLTNVIPGDIVRGPDDRIWFTEPNTNRIARYDPVTGAISEFNIPTADSGVTYLTVGPEGNLWFSETRALKIGRITPSGQFTEFPTIPASGSPGEIIAGPDDNMWFVETTTTGANKIARITSAGAITEFDVPAPPGGKAGARGIAAGPDGNLWFVEEFANKVVKMTTDGVMTEFVIPTPRSVPNSIVAGPDGNLWFTEYAAGKVAQITPAGVITEFPLLYQTDAKPAGITTAPDGNVWFAENSLYETLGRVATSAAVVSAAKTIEPANDLPQITDPVTIDGYTQPGARPNTLTKGDDAVLLVQISGRGSKNSFGLQLQAGESTVRGLVINGFDNAAIRLQDGGNNVIEGCFLGTDPLGATTVSNRYGLEIIDGGSTRVGGPDPAARNLISGNWLGGIDVYSSQNIIQGNYIGTDATGTRSLGNMTGVRFEGGVVNSLTGGTNSGAGNVIAFNNTGIEVTDGFGNAILGNSIFSNATLGISLDAQLNDPGDLDDGPNDKLNYPLLNSLTVAGGTSTIQGTYSGRANTKLRLEFFSNAKPSPSFYGEGQTFLGSTSITTDASGNASFTVTFPGTAQFVSATATDSKNNTSEFSETLLPPAGEFQEGDVFVGVGAGRVEWRRGDGTPVKLLSTSLVSSDDNTRGMGFDAAGNLYVAGYQDGVISKFDRNGNLVGRFGGTINKPASIVFDALGNAFVGTLSNTNKVRKLDPNGNLLKNFNVPATLTAFPGSVDLAPDQRTLYYFGARYRLDLYDVASDQTLPDPAGALVTMDISGFRVLPNGDLLVTSFDKIMRLNPSGTTLQTFRIDGVFGLGDVALDPDGRSFWTVDNYSVLYQLDLQTGQVLTKVVVRPIDQIGGIAVFGKSGATSVGPGLIIERAGVDVAVSWPASPTGFTLESTPSLAPPIPWRPVTATPVVVGNRNTVVETAGSGSRFYRLRK